MEENLKDPEKLEFSSTEVPVSCIIGKTSSGRYLDIKVLKLNKGGEDFIDVKDITENTSEAAVFVRESERVNLPLTEVKSTLDLKLIKFFDLSEIYFYHKFNEDIDGIEGLYEYLEKFSRFFAK